jgi:hypothetical protein
VAINDAVNMVQKMQVYDTPALQQLTMRLYTQIFSYLSKFMAWFTDRSSKRFLKSFNENISRTFQDDLDQIKEISGLLAQQIQLHMSADVRVSKLLHENTNGDMKYLIKLHEAEQKRSRLRDTAYADLIQDSLHCQFQKSREEIESCLQGVMKEYYERMRREISGAAITGLLQHQALYQTPVAPRLLEFSSSHGMTSGDRGLRNG